MSARERHSRVPHYTPCTRQTGRMATGSAYRSYSVFATDHVYDHTTYALAISARAASLFCVEGWTCGAFDQRSSHSHLNSALDVTGGRQPWPHFRRLDMLASALGSVILGPSSQVIPDSERVLSAWKKLCRERERERDASVHGCTGGRPVSGWRGGGFEWTRVRCGRLVALTSRETQIPPAPWPGLGEADRAGGELSCRLPARQ